MSHNYQVKLKLAPSFLDALDVEPSTTKSARVCRLIEIAHDEMRREGLARDAMNEDRRAYTVYLSGSLMGQLDAIKAAHGLRQPLPKILEQLLERAFNHDPNLLAPWARRDLNTGRDPAHKVKESS